MSVAQRRTLRCQYILITRALWHLHETLNIMHIDVRYHFIRKLLENGQIALRYCSTTEMPADIMTKALPKIRHDKLTKMIGINSEWTAQEKSDEQIAKINGEQE